MLPQRPVGRMDVVLVRLESGQPMVQIDILLESADGVLGDAVIQHVSYHALRADLLSSAVRVSDYHDVLHAQFVDGDEHRAHRLSERVGHAAACVLDQHDIAVVQSEGGGKEVDEAGIHAGDDGRLHPRVFRSLVFVVFLVLDEFAIVCEYPVDHMVSHLILESMVSASRDHKASKSAGLNVPGPLQLSAAISAATLKAVTAAAMDSTEAPQAPA